MELDSYHYCYYDSLIAKLNDNNIEDKATIELLREIVTLQALLIDQLYSRFDSDIDYGDEQE